MEYYAISQGVRKGPMTLAQLGRSDLDANTPVWREGMADWDAAGNVPEVRALMDLTTPCPIFGKETKLVSIIGNMMSTTNGKLIIFDDYCTLAPNVGLSVIFANFSKSGYRRNHFGVEEIAELKSGFMAKCSITLIDGTVIKLSMNGKKAIFDELERRRAYWFTSRNMPVLPLRRC